MNRVSFKQLKRPAFHDGSFLVMMNMIVILAWFWCVCAPVLVAGNHDKGAYDIPEIGGGCYHFGSLKCIVFVVFLFYIGNIICSEVYFLK